MRSLIILAAIILVTNCSIIFLDWQNACDHIEENLKTSSNLRSFTVIKSDVKHQTQKAFRKCQLIKELKLYRTRVLHEKMARKKEVERKKIFQKYLQQLAGPTSILKDIPNLIY